MYHRIALLTVLIGGITFSGCTHPSPRFASPPGPIRSYPPQIDRTLAWSPDGQKLAFVGFESASPTISPYGGYWQIYVMDEDGSNAVRLTGSAANSYAPAWSPDGESVAFVSDHDGMEEVYLIAVNGSDLRQLTHCATARCSDPAWSPDGQRIAFVSNSGYDAGVYVLNADSLESVRLTHWSEDNRAVECFDPVWSPDGQSIAFACASEDGIYTVSSDGVSIVRLTAGRGRDPDWSPDGKSLAFISSSRVCLLKTASDEITCLPGLTDRYDCCPSWSSDGRMVAFESNRDTTEGLYVMNVDDFRPIRLTEFRGAGHYPAWSPDEQRIAFYSIGDVCTGIATIGSDGTDLTCLWEER